jgi:hypothetical protein
MCGNLLYSTDKVWEMSRCLLKKIIPWSRITVSIGLENGLAFVTEVMQLVAKGLGKTCKLHTAYFPQHSGKIESMNKTLKLQFGKLCQATHLQWNQSRPISLLRIRSSSTKWTGLSAFEILFRHSLPLVKGLQGDLKEIGDLTLRQQM